MRRRDFIKAIAGSAAAWPIAARTQQSGRLPTVAMLGTEPVAWAPFTAAFAKRLQEIGWIDGRTIDIQYYWTEGRSERYAILAAEVVRLKADVIVTDGPGSLALKQMTAAIPIVFATANDPVGSGLVPSLARPGGNITGLSGQSPDLAGKRLELLRDVVPNLRRLAILYDSGYGAAVLEADQVRAGARTIGLDVAALEIQRAQDIPVVFEGLKAQADALYVVVDSLVIANRTQIITFVLSGRLPSLFNFREFVQAGALMSYGPNVSDQFRRAADMVDKILRGTKPADIPVEQPTKFELAVNLTTARAIGVTIPPNVLALADEVIE